MPKRFLMDVLTVFSLIVLPWWCTGIFILLIIVFFNWPIEVLFLALAFDLLYSVKEMRFYGFVFVFTLSTFVVLIIAEFLKTRLRSYI